MSDKNLSSPLKLGDTVELEIKEINNLGVGVAKHGGLVVFVKGGVTDDTVSAKIIKVAKSFAVAKLDRIIEPSAYRENGGETCRAPLACGGCVWRGVDYAHELDMKKQYVRSAFSKAGIDAKVTDVISTDKIYRYRNKAQYPVCRTKGGVRAGFYASKTHTVIPIGDCMIQNEAFSKIVDLVCRFADKHNISVYNENTGDGLLRHIYLRSADMTGDIMLCLVINGSSLPHADELVAEITAHFPAISGILLNKNEKNTNVVLGKEYTTLWGKSYLEDILCGLKFKIAPEAFYQVNRDGAELLYATARDFADINDRSVVVDLYCGTGTIGLSMAGRAKRVLGVDIVEESITCAKENARENGIENADFACFDAGDPENISNCLKRHGISLSDERTTVIMDPPRKGSTPELIEHLANEGVRRVVYVSCNPDTLARDCALFIKLGYTMSDVVPVNMFPRTGHVESVVSLTRGLDN